MWGVASSDHILVTWNKDDLAAPLAGEISISANAKRLKDAKRLKK
jgi:hypothetical protein